ncbi:DUF3267 domain-containing protein [Thermophagus xiamenensis]|uniref:Putative zincin peptidase n=1 Tax=Thermophagus xiamenensis TaxID=385682 RepID=A0A1I1Y993_9BACT|nr:DUF3267 domain-containing protein [Thermophagus xiamenensis]SFE16131.1 Putative zincin peptidase [Thermophagus xiamenensis]
MTEITITIEEAAKKAMGLIIPTLFVTGIPFFVLHGSEPFLDWNFKEVLFFLFILIAGIPVHELLHALVFGIFARGGFKSVKLGIESKTFTPYCHCSSPIRVQYYRLGALLPFLVLGVIPYIASLFIGSLGWWLYGYFYIIAAGGDLVALKMLKKIPGHRRVLDHPKKMGFYVLD